MIHYALYVVMMLLGLPYVSQEGADWPRYNDCAPAVTSMLIEYYTGESLDPETYYIETGARDRPQAKSMIRDWGAMHGLELSIDYYWTIEDLRQKVMVERIPVVVAILREFNGAPEGHFVIVVGMTKTTVFVHDPILGPAIAIPIERFEREWYYETAWDHNSVVVPTNSIDL